MAQARTDGSAPKWIASWGTAQQLAPSGPPPFARSGPPPAGTASAPRPASPSPMLPFPPTLSDQTVRMIVRTSVGGGQLRLEFSNASGGPAVTFGSVHAALAAADSAIVPQSDRVVTFSGSKNLTLFPGARAVSDPIDLAAPALSRIAVSIHLPQETPVNTAHALGLNPAYIAKGDVTGAGKIEDAQVARSYFWLTGLEVLSDAPDPGVIVALGDSITDGYATTPGAFAAWPDLLAARLQADPATARWGVVNAGISGNRILRAGAGEAAVARFDEDVLARPGVKWVLLLEGINDINMSIMPIIPDSEDVTADQIIAGISQLIDRAHQHGLKIAGGTILPTKGLAFYTEAGERMRQDINAWIRTSGRFDAVIDFDAAVRDPSDPSRLRPDFNPGDHVHPNDAGNRAMVEAIRLELFR
ncbi:SGNH/GDSL hydrolase family protein [Caulobacter sp. NIBR2454]|uniref:SGNH/GDSL hydrolase family protein n=1 Tax=Caulobacter sp. NIBR2454 TaxID=3015996 RepID=UPI0022B66CCE|nr:SGNH/GDSL hydrolase family protein [Caulobacter sp. NIBR2454]